VQKRCRHLALGLKAEANADVGIRRRVAENRGCGVRREEIAVARKTMIVSDLSGEAIEERKGAKIRINFK
jgi:hypothetical protein